MTSKKPGDFHATCRMGSWVPVDEILRLPREEQPETLSTRWDAKLKCEVGVLPCKLDTTDRGEYLDHMDKVHGRKTATWGASKMTSNGALSKRTRVSYRAHRLTEDGTPWVDKETGRTDTCPCGLVIEDDRGSFLQSHLRDCAAESVAS